MKIHSLFLIPVVMFLSACNANNGGSDCTPTTVAAQVEGEGTVPTTSTGCTTPDDTTTTTPPVTPGESGGATGGETGGTTGGDTGGTGPGGDDNSDVPTMAELFDANLTFTNFTTADQDKVEKAVELVKKVIRSGTFRQRMLDHSYGGKKTFVDNRGMSNEQVYLTLLKGAEKLYPEVDHEIDIDLELYTNNSTNVVGYTYPNVTRVWMNRKYFKNYVPAQVARNLIHEWTHKLGFDHASSATSSRPYSVPYGVGTIIEDLCYDVEDGKLVVP